MMQHITAAIEEIERLSTSTNDAIELLRRLGLSDFSNILWNNPHKEYPKASRLLPTMASAEVQNSWTGSSGHTLLSQSVPFVQSVAANYADITGGSLSGKKILDFGCGYGRFLRLFRYYTHNIWGVDPWNKSIDLCVESGLGEKVKLSHYLPESLPVDHDFDFVFAFSVFTHLSERATKASIDTLRKHVKKGAVACITIRPPEYWSYNSGLTDDDRSQLLKSHDEIGFAFRPHYRAPVDGDITYGDTSMSLDYVRAAADGWKIVATDRSLNDPYQRYVFLRAS